jgi:hypothetical protein
MPSDDAGCISEIREALRLRVNQDGGWGYYEGHASRLEPTCWALLGLHAASAIDASAVSASAELFRRWQREDGLLLEPELRTKIDRTSASMVWPDGFWSNVPSWPHACPCPRSSTV